LNDVRGSALILGSYSYLNDSRIAPAFVINAICCYWYS
jgi:hypothetical protein